ncbi:hypothetical protein E2C01_095680 [Portunus trituberculatus]|uniref:Uncharacterized protein n=1 Tax=Portunus trituberculatus TaxID=210409 RepID=A0A5B7JTM3_PORTR|nr:hypothetical protein [Portunus trituberculatus]
MRLRREGVEERRGSNPAGLAGSTPSPAEPTAVPRVVVGGAPYLLSEWVQGSGGSIGLLCTILKHF